ncbi:Aspartate-rich protein 1 [Plecturocebus cupreus]
MNNVVTKRGRVATGGQQQGWALQKVSPCYEPEIPQAVVAAATASTTAEPAASDSGGAEVQYMQPITNSKMPKGKLSFMMGVAFFM